MDLGLNEQQEMLRKMARDFLTTECPKKLVRDMEEDEKGYSLELWSKMAELGWLGLPFAEQYGGMGSSFLDLCVLLEEMGRACLPSPFFTTVVLSGLAIADAGDDAQKQEFLPAIANGENNNGMSKENMYVAECFVCPGPILKRIQPRAHGRAFRINKRSSHITLVLKEKES